MYSSDFLSFIIAIRTKTKHAMRFNQKTLALYNQSSLMPKE